MSRAGVNYHGNTLQFYLLVLRNINEEARRVTDAVYLAQIAQVQTVSQAGSMEQAKAITSAFQDLIARVVSRDTRVNVTEESEQEKMHKRDIALKKAEAIKDLALESKPFASLSEVLSAVHYKLNNTGDAC